MKIVSTSNGERINQNNIDKIITSIWTTVEDKQFSSIINQLDLSCKHSSNIGLAMGKNALSLALAFDDIVSFDKIIILQPKGYTNHETDDEDRCIIFDVSHPLPTIDNLNFSIQGIELIKKWIRKDPALVLHVLISGGASASFVIPEDGISIDQYAAIVSAAMSEGFPIEALNFVRIMIDKVKGGKLTNYFPKTKIHSWIVSDVISDDPAIIGSGPTSINPNLFKRQLSSKLCKWLKANMIENSIPDSLFDDLVKRVKLTHENMDDRSKDSRIVSSIILSRKDFVNSLICNLNKLGLNPRIDSIGFDLELEEATVYLEKLILENIGTIGSSPIILMGEITLRLNSLRGQGGRISALCFLLSKRLQKYPGITFMGFATDGKDGSSPDPGYMINSQTYEKLAEIGDFDDMYDSQNTGRYLSDIGAGIRLKRQTNINLLDLIIIF